MAFYKRARPQDGYARPLPGRRRPDRLRRYVPCRHCGARSAELLAPHVLYFCSEACYVARVTQAHQEPRP